MMNNLQIKDHMNHQPLIVAPTDLITQVIEALLSSKQEQAIVTDGDLVVGVLTKIDCLKNLLANSYYCDGAPQAKEFMNTDFIQVTAQDNVFDLAQRMTHSSSNFNNQTDFPVMNGDLLTGTIGINEIMTALNQHFVSCQAY